MLRLKLVMYKTVVAAEVLSGALLFCGATGRNPEAPPGIGPFVNA